MAAATTTAATAAATCCCTSPRRSIPRSIPTSVSSPFHPRTRLFSPLPLPLLPLSFPPPRLPSPPRSMANDTIVEEKLGVRVERNPPESRLADLGVRSWPKWGCPPSKFPWTYAGTETCYLLKGKVKVYGENSSEYIEIGAGDLVVFPNGMSCTWDVSEAVDKHYSFS